MANWKKGYDPNNLAHKYETAKERQGDGSIVFNGLGILQNDALLYSMLDYSDEIHERVAREWVNEAVFAAAYKGRITQQTLLEEFSALESNYLNLPIQRFVLVTSLSIRGVNFKFIRFDSNVTISFFTRPLRTFQSQAARLIENGSYRLFGELPTNYYPLRIFVSGRGIHEAANKALDQLDIVRGAWNWAVNVTQPLRWSQGKPLPVNKVMLGPIHTLHFPDGKLAAGNTWWYEPSYLGPIQTYDVSQNVDRLQKSLNYVRSRIKKSPYGEELRSGLLRYTRALDERNWYDAYLKLWSVLEFLTNTNTRNTTQVDTIERTAFLYEERAEHLQVLRHLREYRNRFVHADAENSDIETFMYLLKNYVEVLLGFLFKNRFGFKSLEEAARFMDLPIDKSDLANRIRNLRNAQNFLGHKK